jgi:predicted RNA-binding protein with PUA-like domain
MPAMTSASRTSRRYWLIKSEPFKYAWERLVADGRTHWDGVRNFEARNNLRSMSVGDLSLFYHSNEGREIVGVAQVVRAAYADPTSDEDWSVVDVAPVKPLLVPVTLETVKADAVLAKMALVRRSRLSVAPVEPEEFTRVLALGRTRVDPTTSSSRRR